MGRRGGQGAAPLLLLPLLLLPLLLLAAAAAAPRPEPPLAAHGGAELRFAAGWARWRPAGPEGDPCRRDAGPWMPRYHSRRLGELTLPGTHDSGSYTLSKRLIPGAFGPDLEAAIEVAEELGIPVDRIITPWALSTRCDVLQQLRAGARYVDVRAGWDGALGERGEWVVHHAEEGVRVEAVLRQVAAFLAQRPTEIVLVELSHFYGSPGPGARRALAELAVAVFGDLLHPKRRGLGATLGELVAAGTRAVVTFEFEDDETAAEFPTLWPADTFLNTYADTDDLEAMEGFNRRQIEAFDGPDRPGPRQLAKISWTLTPTGRAVRRGLVPGRHHPHSLVELADGANAALPAFAAAEAAGKRRLMGNVLLLDAIEASAALAVAQQINEAWSGGGPA